jgi:hypothetical protein
MFFTEPALLNRQLLSDLLRPLDGLSFRLGVAAGSTPERRGFCIHAHHKPTELRVDM